MASVGLEAVSAVPVGIVRSVRWAGLAVLTAGVTHSVSVGQRPSVRSGLACSRHDGGSLPSSACRCGRVGELNAGRLCCWVGWARLASWRRSVGTGWPVRLDWVAWLSNAASAAWRVADRLVAG